MKSAILVVSGTAVLLAAGLKGISPTVGQAPSPATLVVRGGNIVTVDNARPEAEALAAMNDTIVAVGSNQEIQRYIGPATRVIDLHGALAVPGFIDAHAHFTGVGEAARNLRLGTATDWDDIVQMVAEAAKTARPGEWILGRGWHQEKWSHTPSPNVEGFPLHEALSRVSPNNPVWLTHASGHAGFANALAMKMAEVTKTTPDPAGGKILRDSDGNATGLFNERAQSIVGDALARDRATRTPAQVEADLRTVIELASREALSKGLTTVADAGSPPLTIDVMKKVVDERKLPLRVWMMLREAPDKLDADMPKYRVVNYGDRRFTVRGIKRAIDGALGSRGAWMLQPYADLSSTSGLNTDSLDDIRRSAELAIRDDYQLAVHAIGDRGNRETLNIYEQTFARHPEKAGRALRWRIEHAQHLNAADIPRFGRLGVIASMQGIHATSDAVFVLARLGPARAFEEGIKGSLAAGKLADITVFSKDLMTIPEDQIPTTKVLYTIVGGAVQYSSASGTSNDAR